MEKMMIHTSSVHYPIMIESGIRHQLAALLQEQLSDATAYFIITDKNVEQLYLSDVRQALSEHHLPIYHYTVEAGEQAKSFDNYYAILTAALENKLDRKSVFVALGGGVVGDLTGYVSATFLRGVRYVQVPTTLLAHDSAVGGKTAINHPHGKNLIGAFHQPAAVIYDTETLQTLPDQEWLSGFAEVIKHGIIGDTSFLSSLHRNVHSLEDLKTADLEKVIKQAVTVKANIVQEDEKEVGIRAFLNFGHTLGHAIEAELGYGKITHGEAVAIGMKYALKLSEALFNKNIGADQTILWLNKLTYSDLPKQLEYDQLIKRMRADKKAIAGEINMVLLKEMGSPCIVPVSEEILRSAFTT